MARKKIVFVIVEGPSDDTALGVILNRIFDSNTVHIEITHGDITSDWSDESTNILEKVAEFIDAYAANNHYNKEHFQQIIHLIDTDGTYIPDTSIVEDPSAVDKPVYSETEIHTAVPENIEMRNRYKRKAMDRLAARKTIWGVPYQCYYMSCNLDHALYGKQNSSDDEKENDSYEFAKRYKDDIPGFLKLLCDSEISVSGDYLNSWKFIREDLHSLERHTNFGIAFEDFYNELNN